MAPSPQDDDILAFRKPGALERTRNFGEPIVGKLKLRESSCVNVGAEPSQDEDHSVRLTQADFWFKLAPSETSPALWAARRKLPSPEDVL